MIELIESQFKNNHRRGFEHSRHFLLKYYDIIYNSFQILSTFFLRLNLHYQHRQSIHGIGWLSLSVLSAGELVG